MAKISPTRMNLLSRKLQFGLAGEGVELLKHKREVLISEFMELVKPLTEKQKMLHREFVEAFHCLNTARAIDGRGSMEFAAFLRESQVQVDLHLVKTRVGYS